MSTPLTPAQKAEAVKRANNVHRFPTLVPITRMDGTVGPINPTTNQRHLLDFLAEFAWTYLVKYRQGMSSTIHVADQLRHVSYNAGHMGMLIGDKEDTYKELMRRMANMYDGLNENIRPALARPPSSEMIVFDQPHNGLVQGVTGGGENPSIGFSPDYAILSEFGLYENYDRFNPAFFPAINRRPNAKCRVETTPGTYNSKAHVMFRDSLAGRGRFKALYLAWWRDETCISHDPAMPPDFRRTQEEDAYAKRINDFDTLSLGKPWYPYDRPHPISDQHIWFRRIALETEFYGDPRLFDNKYPPSPFEGWLVGSSPTIPSEPLERMRPKAIDVEEGVEKFLEQREAGCPYLITVDGKGYGKGGDPAAIVLWNLWDWRAVGMWTGREDPGLLAPRVLRWQKMFDAHVIVETNKDGVAAALQAHDCPRLFWSSTEQPGWYSSSVSKKVAINDLVDILRAHEVDIPFAPIIEQLASWDGRTRADASGGATRHHWDLAICCLIFAYGVKMISHTKRPQPKVEKPYTGLTVEEFLKGFEEKSQGRVLGRWD